MQTFEFPRLARLLRKRRYLIVMAAFAVVLVSVAGTWWVSLEKAITLSP